MSIVLNRNDALLGVLSLRATFVYPCAYVCIDVITCIILNNTLLSRTDYAKDFFPDNTDNDTMNNSSELGPNSRPRFN